MASRGAFRPARVKDERVGGVDAELLEAGVRRIEQAIELERDGCTGQSENGRAALLVYKIFSKFR